MIFYQQRLFEAISLVCPSFSSASHHQMYIFALYKHVFVGSKCEYQKLKKKFPTLELLLHIKLKWNIYINDTCIYVYNVLYMLKSYYKVTSKAHQMIYRWPGLLAFIWFVSSLAPSPVSLVDRRVATHRKNEKGRQLADRRGGEGGGGKAKSHDRKKAWPSINYSIFAGDKRPTTTACVCIA